MAAWLTVGDERLPDLWDGSADLSDAGLALVLAAAREQCEAYGPTQPDPDNVPARWVIAHALQARALTRAGFVGAADQGGGFGDQVTVYPMDWQVKNLLRPKRKANPK